MLAVRRMARPGGLYGGARGIGVYSAVQGALGILIAFVIFLAFQSYLGARSAAQDEATAVLQLFRTAELFPRPHDLRGGGAVGPGARAGGLDLAVQRRRPGAGPPAPPVGGGALRPVGALGHADRRSVGRHLVLARVRRPLRTRARPGPDRCRAGGDPRVGPGPDLLLRPPLRGFKRQHPARGHGTGTGPDDRDPACDGSAPGSLPDYLIDCW